MSENRNSAGPAAPHEPSEKKLGPKGRVLQLPSKAIVSELPPLKALETEDEIHHAIETVDLWNTVDLTMLSKRLVEADPELVSVVLEEGLDRPSRSRILTVASDFAGEDLGGFWQKVIESPEIATVSVEDREESNPTRNHEIYLAIRALRVLATQDISAREYLQRVVLDGDLHQSDLMLRKQAFLALREVDGGRAARILRQLDDTDELSQL